MFICLEMSSNVLYAKKYPTKFRFSLTRCHSHDETGENRNVENGKQKHNLKKQVFTVRAVKSMGKFMVVILMIR